MRANHLTCCSSTTTGILVFLEPNGMIAPPRDEPHRRRLKQPVLHATSPENSHESPADRARRHRKAILTWIIHVVKSTTAYIEEHSQGEGHRLAQGPGSNRSGTRIVPDAGLELLPTPAAPRSPDWMRRPPAQPPPYLLRALGIYSVRWTMAERERGPIWLVAARI